MKDLRWGDCPGGPSAITGVLGHERRARVREGEVMMNDGWRRETEGEGGGIEREGWGGGGERETWRCYAADFEDGERNQEPKE